jgi:hypothetical protein
LDHAKPLRSMHKEASQAGLNLSPLVLEDAFERPGVPKSTKSWLTWPTEFVPVRYLTYKDTETTALICETIILHFDSNISLYKMIIIGKAP